MIRILFKTSALLLLLLLAACSQGEQPASVDADPDALKLRIYPLPAARADAIRDALATVLGGTAELSLLPPDQLLVLAPLPVHSSLLVTLDTLRKSVPQPVADPGPVRLTLWIVDVTDSTGLDPRLAPLAATLDAIRGSLAAPGFVLHAQLSLLANAGDREVHSVGDAHAKVQARLTANDGGVDAYLVIDSGEMNVITQTRLKYGEAVVQAQATPTEDERTRVRLTIVRADLAG
ncbi:MAG: hypothetical protein AB7E72_21075 [Lysobacterales bacterium]